MSMKEQDAQAPLLQSPYDFVVKHVIQKVVPEASQGVAVHVWQRYATKADSNTVSFRDLSYEMARVIGQYELEHTLYVTFLNAFFHRRKGLLPTQQSLQKPANEQWDMETPKVSKAGL